MVTILSAIATSPFSHSCRASLAGGHGGRPGSSIPYRYVSRRGMTAAGGHLRQTESNSSGTHEPPRPVLADLIREGASHSSVLGPMIRGLSALRLSREAAAISPPCRLASTNTSIKRARDGSICAAFSAIRAGAGLFLELQHDVFSLSLGAVQTLFYKVVRLLLQHLDIKF
jgi:hypothetical protein